jgi:outer membrane protein assembly factor BamE (lipoprotein component of BamABCDE complex)
MSANRRLLPAAVLALCWVAAATGHCLAGEADPGQPRAFSPAALAKVSPGKSTKAQVERLLGQPWRTTFSDDQDEPAPSVWEYRGADASGTYILHIEFDGHDKATLVAKIPDATGEAPARVAKTPPAPAER